jgi:hypothetical protein
MSAQLLKTLDKNIPGSESAQKVTLGDGAIEVYPTMVAAEVIQRFAYFLAGLSTVRMITTIDLREIAHLSPDGRRTGNLIFTI